MTRQGGMISCRPCRIFWLWEVRAGMTGAASFVDRSCARWTEHLTFRAEYIILAQVWNCEDGKQYPAGGRAERERMVRAPGRPPEKSSRSIAAERAVSRGGVPRYRERA